MKRSLAILFVMVFIVLLFGCGSDVENVTPVQAKPEKSINEMTIEEKVQHGINTGTPADINNRNPYSVFQPYSPWNIYQNP